MRTPPNRQSAAGPDVAPRGGTGRTVPLLLVSSLVLGALLVAEAAMRPRTGSHDAYEYLDIASNLAEGKGLVLSVPGYNSPRFPVLARWPQPFTAQPPLYPWLASLAIRAGAEPTAALTTLVAAGMVVTWFAGAWLAAALWGATAGALALSGLALCSLSPELTSRVWSDPVAFGLTLCALAALLRAGTAGSRGIRWALAAGALAGLAFLTRYVCGLLFPFGIAWLLCLRPRFSRLHAAFAYGLSSAVLAAPLIARNLAVAGGAFGEPRNPSTQDLADVVSSALRLTWGRVPDGLRLAAGVAVVALALVMLASPGSRARVRETLAAGAGLVPAWGLTYAITIVALRLSFHFDILGVRLVAPSLLAGALLLAGLTARLLPLPRTAANVAVSLALLVAAGNVGLRIRATPDPQRLAGSRSEFFSWLAAETPPGAVLIAEEGVDMAWSLRREPGAARRIASFSPWPYMPPLTQDDFTRFAGHAWRPGGPPLRVVVRGEEEDDAAWRRRSGDPIADAVAGKVPDGDGLVLERIIQGKRVLRWRPAAEPPGSVPPGP